MPGARQLRDSSLSMIERRITVNPDGGRAMFRRTEVARDCFSREAAAVLGEAAGLRSRRLIDPLR
jgi:hypothetical protein